MEADILKRNQQSFYDKAISSMLFSRIEKYNKTSCLD